MTMPNYRYRATGPDGASYEDSVDAESSYQATLRLQERGYTVNEITASHGEFAVAGSAKQLSWADLELLARQLLSVTERGLPLVPALKAFTSDMPESKLRAVIDQLRIDLERGETVEEALKNRGAALPPLFVSAVRAGEASGAGLPGVFRILVEHSARMVSLQNTLHAALAYPLLVVLLSCGVVCLLLWRVIPVYAEINSSAAQVSPRLLYTAYVLNFVAAHPVALGVGCFAVGLGMLQLARYFSRTYASSLRSDRLKLHVPRFGHVYYLITVARFSRTLAALLRVRVPVVEAIELAAAASGSPVLQHAAGEAAPRVALGNTISDALFATNYFGPGFCWLLDTGERRNAAEEVLESLAESCEMEATAYDQANMQLIGPLALVFAGGIVLLIATQLFIPIGAAFGWAGF